MNNLPSKQLKEMKGKTFQYASQIHYVIDVYIDEENDKFTIKTHLTTYSRNLENLGAFMDYWIAVSAVDDISPLHNDSPTSTVAIFREENDMTGALIKTLTDNIEKVKTDPKYIPQAQVINNNVNSIINIARMRFDMMREIGKLNKLERK